MLDLVRNPKDWFSHGSGKKLWHWCTCMQHYPDAQFVSISEGLVGINHWFNLRLQSNEECSVLRAVVPILYVTDSI